MRPEGAEDVPSSPFSVRDGDSECMGIVKACSRLRPMAKGKGVP